MKKELTAHGSQLTAKQPSAVSRQRSAGFTLIEVIVAVTLLGVISILVWQAMGAVTGSKERFERREDTFRGATLALNRMTRDLEMAVLFANMELLGLSTSGEQMSKSVFLGANNGDQDKITFETLSHIRYLKDVKESDTAEVSYFVEPMEEAGLFALKKRESSPPDANPEEGGSTTTLLERVKELNLRYYDPVKGEYLDEWDSTKIDYLNKMPRAVEIVLVLQDPIDEEETVRMMTVALLEMAPGPNDF